MSCCASSCAHNSARWWPPLGGEAFINVCQGWLGAALAFTPTCSARHLPGFIASADDMMAKGVTAIACLSVNDAWVMDAWGKDQGVGDKIVMLADGSGHLTRALGLELDRTSGGMGMRSRRYAMVVDDGRVSQLNIEADGKFEVSDAQTMLSVL